ncbi:putative holin-like toxin [Geobacillus stearothermophilus]|nr:putative holin-like toxin [Geobacillus stearothermophilus]MED4987018.1 putative holin-like toxin [Geobacillus stearothermophilus]
MMSIADALTLMIAFASLIVAVIAVSKDKKQPTLLGRGEGRLRCPRLGPLRFLQRLCMDRALVAANSLLYCTFLLLYYTRIKKGMTRTLEKGTVKIEKNEKEG